MADLVRPDCLSRRRDLARLSDDELGRYDIAAVNLSVAVGLPGWEAMDPAFCLATLDQWTGFVRWVTERLLPTFHQHPAESECSEARFRAGVLVNALQKGPGLQYNLAKVPPEGRRGRGAAGKVAVFGILKQGGAVYAQMIADCGQATWVPITRRKVAPNSVVHPDAWGGYDTLSVEGHQRERVDHDEELVAAGGRHINGIENFWNQAKRHLRRFNGVPRASFPLFLQECVWRFNAGAPGEQLRSLRKLLRRSAAG